MSNHSTGLLYIWWVGVLSLSRLYSQTKQLLKDEWVDKRCLVCVQLYHLFSDTGMCGIAAVNHNAVYDECEAWCSLKRCRGSPWHPGDINLYAAILGADVSDVVLPTAPILRVITARFGLAGIILKAHFEVKIYKSPCRQTIEHCFKF